MTRAGHRVLPLVEFVRQRFPRQELPDNLAEVVWRQYSQQIALEWPSPKTDGQWELMSQGWVGYIPLSNDITLALQPKVPLANLFRMLEYAYQLKGLRFLEGQVNCTTLEEFYDLLAKVLALRIVDRERLGLYRAYVGHSERTPFLRGHLDLAVTLRSEWRADFQCSFEEHTADVEENQILAWTLSRVLEGGLCNERVLSTVRRAYRGLQGLVTTSQVPASACVGRLYNRLCDDYEPLHALCRFFLEHAGPGHSWGDRKMIPFLIDMSRLYELFVAEWLKSNLPPSIGLRAQERVNIGSGDNLHFQIDLVLYDLASGQVLCVLDTKYKGVQAPALDDLSQVIAYAEAKGCAEAVLVYPLRHMEPFDRTVGRIRVRSVAFRLDEDLEDAGQEFMRELSLATRAVREIS